MKNIISISALAAIGLINLNKSDNDKKSNTRGNKRNKVDLYSDIDGNYVMNYDRNGNPIFYNYFKLKGIVIDLKNDQNGYPILYDKEGNIVKYRNNIDKEEVEKKEEVNSYKIKEIKIKNGDWNKSFVKIERRVKSSKDWVGLYFKGEKPGGDIFAIKYGYVNDDGEATLNQGDSRLNNNQKAMSREYTVYLFQNDTYTVLAAETFYIE